jgi:hypothetical protein
MLSLNNRTLDVFPHMHDVEKVFNIDKIFEGKYKRINMISPDGSDKFIDVMIPVYKEVPTYEYKYDKLVYDIKLCENKAINITSFQVNGDKKVLSIWLKLNGTLSGMALPPISDDSDIYIIRIPSLYVGKDDVRLTKIQIEVYCEADGNNNEPEITLFSSNERQTETKIGTNFTHSLFQSYFEIAFDEIFMSEDFPITYHYPNGEYDAKPYLVENELFVENDNPDVI